MHDDADLEPEEAVDLPHPFGVALGEVIVDGDDMDAAAGERVEIDRQRRDQRLAFAGLHLGNLAFVQDHAADQLHVEMSLADGALRCLADGRERRHQNVIERLAVGELLPELSRARAQRLVGERFQFLFQRIDFVHARTISLDLPLIGGAKHLAGKTGEHQGQILFVPHPGCGLRRPMRLEDGAFRASCGGAT